MSEQALVPTKMMEASLSEFKPGETAYVSPNEITTTKDQKNWLSMKHLATGFPSDYRCARVDLHENGSTVDWSACEDYLKENALKPGLDVKPPEGSLPVMNLSQIDDLDYLKAVNNVSGSPPAEHPGSDWKKAELSSTSPPMEPKSSYVHPSELFATPDRKLWLSTKHSLKDRQDDYYCARVQRSEAGVKVDLSDCLQSSKTIMINDFISGQDRHYRTPVIGASGWNETYKAQTFELIKAREQNGY